MTLLCIFGVALAGLGLVTACHCPCPPAAAAPPAPLAGTPPGAASASGRSGVPSFHSVRASTSDPASTSDLASPSPSPDGHRAGTGPENRSDTNAPAPLDCQRPDPYGPAALTAEQYAGRYGADVHEVAALATSKERPVEVCGVSGELAYLVALSCRDGSHPFADAHAAREARRGSVGLGGRCRAVIDVYQVACPEKTYLVHMDMYFCQAGQEFR